MTIYQKSFFDGVKQQAFGIIHIKNELKAKQSPGHLELPGFADPSPNDNYVFVYFLKDTDLDFDEGR